MKNIPVSRAAESANLASPSILIVLMGSLGDVARGLGLVNHLKSHLVDCRISWLVEPKCADLVKLHPQIDQVVVFQRAWSISAIADLYWQLRQNRYDISLDLQRHLKSGFFAWLSKSPRRIGFHRRNTKEFNWIFNNEHIHCHDDNLPKINHYFKFTEHMGLPEPASINFGLANVEIKHFDHRSGFDRRHPYVAVLMGSRWQSKNWFSEGYRQLVGRLLSTGSWRVVLIGDQSQVEVAAKISEQPNARDLINLVGKTTLLELIAVLKNATAVVGPDSGPGHLAAALSTPYITLFGPTSPQRTAPYGCEHLVVQSELKCRPCYRKQCPENTQQCMHSISADQVMQKLSQVLR